MGAADPQRAVSREKVVYIVAIAFIAGRQTDSATMAAYVVAALSLAWDVLNGSN